MCESNLEETKNLCKALTKRFPRLVGTVINETAHQHLNYVELVVDKITYKAQASKRGTGVRLTRLMKGSRVDIRFIKHFNDTQAVRDWFKL